MIDRILNTDWTAVWECPKCGAQIAQAPNVLIHPSKCAMGHPPTEMEQRTADAWGVGRDDS